MNLDTTIAYITNSARRGAETVTLDAIDAAELCNELVELRKEKRPAKAESLTDTLLDILVPKQTKGGDEPCVDFRLTSGTPHVSPAEPTSDPLVSATPRTDALVCAVWHASEAGGNVKQLVEMCFDFARTLERELAEAKANDIREIDTINKALTSRDATIDRLTKERDDLATWKESQLAVEREWNPNELALLVGGRLGESQRAAIQREVPKIIAERDSLRQQLADTEGALKDTFKELKALMEGESCDHSVGICYCHTFSVIDNAAGLLATQIKGETSLTPVSQVCAERDSLRQQLADAVRERDEALDNARVHKEARKSELGARHKTVAEYGELIQAMESERDAARAEVATLQVQLDFAKENVKAANQFEESIRQDRDELLQQVATLKAEVERLKAELDENPECELCKQYASELAAERADNARLREALEDISKAEGHTDKLVCLATITHCRQRALQALSTPPSTPTVTA